MKKSLLIAILVGITCWANAQTTNANDEINTLKKQISSLKQTNAKLDQTVKELRKSSKDVENNVSVKLKEYDQKIGNLQDSLKAGKATLATIQNRESQLFHALNLRKTIAYIAFAVVAILLAALYFLLIGKLKTTTEKSEAKLYNIKDALEVEAAKTKSEFQTQLTSIKSEIATVRDDLEKKIKDLKK